MQLQPIQFILIIFIVFALSRVYLRVKEGTFSFGEALFWLGLFSISAFGVIDPGFTTFLARQLGIGRGADVAIYLSIVLLFYMIFRIHVMMENLRHEHTKLVREIALLDKAKKNAKK